MAQPHLSCCHGNTNVKTKQRVSDLLGPQGAEHRVRQDQNRKECEELDRKLVFDVKKTTRTVSHTHDGEFT